MEHRSNLPYTCAFVEELFRYFSVAPLGIPHKTTEDMNLRGFFLPKGTLVNSF